MGVFKTALLYYIKEGLLHFEINYSLYQAFHLRLMVLAFVHSLAVAGARTCFQEFGLRPKNRLPLSLQKY